MVSKIMQTAHNCSAMNKSGNTQPAVVGSVVSVGYNPQEEVELEEPESEVLRTAQLKEQWIQLYETQETLSVILTAQRSYIRYVLRRFCKIAKSNY